MTISEIAARLRGISQQLRTTGASPALIREITRIAGELERTRSMSERFRQAVYAVIVSTQPGESGNFYVQDSETYSWAMSELHAIVAEIAPKQSGR